MQMFLKAWAILSHTHQPFQFLHPTLSSPMSLISSSVTVEQPKWTRTVRSKFLKWVDPKMQQPKNNGRFFPFSSYDLKQEFGEHYAPRTISGIQTDGGSLISNSGPPKFTGNPQLLSLIGWYGGKQELMNKMYSQVWKELTSLLLTLEREFVTRPCLVPKGTRNESLAD